MNAVSDIGSFKFLDNKIIIRIRDRVCESPDALLSSQLFANVLEKFVKLLIRQDSPMLDLFGKEPNLIEKSDINMLINTIRLVARVQTDWAIKLVDDKRFLEKPALLYEFIEGLYDYWRKFERFLICDSDGDVLDQRPYRTFNSTVETLMNLVRGTYRDVQEALSGKHPRIYRQVVPALRLQRLPYQRICQVWEYIKPNWDLFRLSGRFVFTHRC
ncbi:MAG: hypothetical protein WCK35_04505 [Chloroflexota bacterium]